MRGLGGRIHASEAKKLSAVRPGQRCAYRTLIISRTLFFRALDLRHRGGPMMAAIEDFITWYCSEPHLAFGRTLVLRYAFVRFRTPKIAYGHCGNSCKSPCVEINSEKVISRIGSRCALPLVESCSYQINMGFAIRALRKTLAFTISGTLKKPSMMQHAIRSSGFSLSSCH
jgi:hypothetical protein